MWKKLKIWKEKFIQKASPTFNTCFLWVLMAVFAGVDAAGLKAGGISLAPGILLHTVIATAALLAVSVMYTYFRRDVRIAALAQIAAAILVFSAVAMVFSYLSVAWRLPLIDDYLVAADRALGLDWPASYRWVIAHAFIHRMLLVAYASLIPQLLILLLTLNFLRQIGRCWELLWLFIVACVICLLVAGFWPAAGAFGYFHIEESQPYVRVFTALHEGTLKVIGIDTVQGIAQFPSLHAALGIVFTYAARGIRVLFPLFLVLNILLLFSTPAIGGHHFADLWGGLVLAGVTVWIVRTAFSFNQEVVFARGEAGGR